MAVQEHTNDEKDIKIANKEENEQQEAKSNTRSRRIGFGINGIQLIATFFFAYMIIELNILPTNYIIIISLILIVLWVLPFVGQYFSKKKGILVKGFSSVITIALLVGGFYVMRTNEAIAQITEQEVAVDSMVVVVLANDSAETLEDVTEYTFGVQYATMGEEVADTMKHLEDEMGCTLQRQEYVGLAEQLNSLLNGETDVVVYNEAYAELLQENIPGYVESTKVIYTYEIEEEPVVEEPVVEPVEEVEDESFTVYISGIDVYGSITKKSRSDVNILATVNPTTQQVLLVSTPRDYFVEIPGISGDSKDKLTHAGIYGIDASIDTMEALYDTEVDYYIRVNFTSVVEMVNALGGVEVYSDYSFTAFDGTRFQEGVNTLTGKEALSFARERKNVPSGDLQRGMNQQIVIEAMIDKAISPAILTGALDLLASVSENMQTDMPEEHIQELVKLQLEEGIDWDIVSISAEGTGTWSRECYSLRGNSLSIIEPDEESIEYIHEAIETVRAGEIFQDTAVVTE